MLGLPVGAAAETADLGVTGEVVSSDGKERAVQFTLTNNGPDDAVVTGNLGLDLSTQGPAEILSVEPCGPSNNTVSGYRHCGFGGSLPAGASVSLEAQVRVTGPAAQISAFEYYSDGGEDFDPAELLQDPNGTNGVVYVPLDAAPGCDLQAKGPQKANKALVVTVFGGTSGCEAKLKAAKLKIGNKVYTFIKKKPAKEVAPGEKWKVSVPIKGDVLKTVNEALAAKKNVKAAAEFDLGGQAASIVVRIK